ncbi:cobalamin B12-binding domain-containing protein [Actinomadura fibrosa]|uniref:B12-binding domain-containing protein n=1 Tax=Actinomadura fibrosa TaxID=111802 RepID=A0ABW2XHY1_9ACTN|nr:cobalamin B12-binding domain-containing protein [Actinomadura fibrosa]
MRADPWTDRLWTMVVSGRERSSVQTAFAALDAGLAPEALLMDVVAAVQDRVGAEWALGGMTVAQEHAATAISERVIAALAHHPSRPAPPGPPVEGRITVACAEGEWHALPARLLAEVLRLRGWDVEYLGAQVPTRYLATHLRRTRPAVVALSASMTARLPAAHQAITAARDLGVPVLAGGPAFGSDGRHARLLEAAGWAPDARTAADLLAKGIPPLRPTGSRPALPHLDDQEYSLITRSSAQLAHDVQTALPPRFARGHTDQEVEWVELLIDVLAAALYVDDADLFTTATRWTAGILAARGVDDTVVLAALDVMARALTDFPRAAALLTAARTTLHPLT